MKGNHKRLHYQDIKKYYHCLKMIENQDNLLSSAQQELVWYENKLQEGKELVKSFDIINQEIENLPKINLSQEKTDREQVESILVSIRECGEKIHKNQELISLSTEQINAYPSKDILIDKLNRLKSQRFWLQITVVIYSIVYVVIFVAILAAAIYVLLALLVLGAFIGVLSEMSKK